MMATRRITVELDDETIRHLAALGEPIEVLELLAKSAAGGVSRPDRERRAKTDQSLQTERDKTDDAIAKERAIAEAVADEVVRLARERADHVVQVARDAPDGSERRPQSAASAARSERERTRADGLVQDERSDADALLDHHRVQQRRSPDKLLVGERQTTDKDLIDERADIDTLIGEQREANEQMVRATLRAQELTVEADAAKERAENSEDELRAVAEFRELFIGILGHDLRTPLATIVNSAAVLLRRGRLDEQDAAATSRIIRSSQRMTRMITQLLDLTRARLGGGLPIEPAPTDLRELCRNVVDEFDATVQLVVEGDVSGNWDPDRLAEVLSNVTGNAIEYAAPGTDVLIHAYADGPAVVVEISNQGAPIPAEIFPFIFEPFRGAKQRKDSARGNLGLGLYIAKQIVLAHRGTLDAHCAGGTTTFVMRLPRS
jgi:signal transduction histidine kinase